MNKHKKFQIYYQNISAFLRDTIGSEVLLDEGDYIPGSQRIDFYSDFQKASERLELHELPHTDEPTEHEYEDGLITRISDSRDFNLLILVGGLGAGKSTTVRYLSRALRKEKRINEQTCACGKDQCPRAPLVVDCIKLGEGVKRKAMVRRVMKMIRFSLYARLIEEWLGPYGLDPEKVALRYLVWVIRDLETAEPEWETNPTRHRVALWKARKAAIPRPPSVLPPLPQGRRLLREGAAEAEGRGTTDTRSRKSAGSPTQGAEAPKK